jgi:hypothetical protein
LREGLGPQGAATCFAATADAGAGGWASRDFGAEGVVEGGEGGLHRGQGPRSYTQHSCSRHEHRWFELGC